MSLTNKELLLIQDNIKMTQNSINFMQSCSDFSSDSDVRNLIQKMTTEHQSDLQILMKHINTANMQ